mgnify:CR=1 FL=1
MKRQQRIQFITCNRVKDSYGITSGLFNSASFVCNFLKEYGFESKLNAVVDSNSIDKAVFDVVIYQNKLHAIGDDGLYQYSLNPANIEEITILSSISY